MTTRAGFELIYGCGDRQTNGWPPQCRPCRPSFPDAWGGRRGASTCWYASKSTRRHGIAKGKSRHHFSIAGWNVVFLVFGSADCLLNRFKSTRPGRPSFTAVSQVDERCNFSGDWICTRTNVAPKRGVKIEVPPS